MSKGIRYSGFILLLIIIAVSTTTQSAELSKRYRIDFKVGGWSPTYAAEDNSSGDLVSVSLPDNGLVAGFGCGHWINEKWAVTIAISTLSVGLDYRVGFLQTSTSHTSVITFLMGGRYYFSGEDWHPYLSLAVGPYYGIQNQIKIGNDVVIKSTSQSVPGCRLGGGIDLQLSRLFMLDADVGYNLVSNFSENIGNRENYSGPDFTIGLSLLLGGEIRTKGHSVEK
nr:outer membrane beta-barrel protein [candidate division Zixibacteria bacterium]